MPGLWRTTQACRVHKRSGAGMPAPPERDEPLGHKGSIEAVQRNDVGDCAERHKMQEREQIRLAAQVRPKIAPAQFACHGDQCQEHQPDRSQMPKAREIVSPIRIDDGDGFGKFFIGLVMVDHHGIETELPGFRERFDAGDSAVHRNEQFGAALRQGAAQGAAYSRAAGNETN